ncbi:MAG: ribonuclease III [Rothia sp. (in: high G+C Gram-positive bacteria)]|nr:ribonuclease III [Rothia sp. (in: high G+C Gram-positive bacteria)]
MKNSDSSDLLKRLGVDIDPETFQHALTHSSYSFEHPGVANNERLEFLGDSVLSLAIAEEVYRLFPDLPEGELVKKHHVVVSSWALAGIARSLNVGDHIRLGKGERKTGGQNKDSILADTMEAIFGACYLANGREAARELVLRLVGPLLHDEKILDAGRDWKTELQERVQSRNMGELRYEIVSSGPEHTPVYTATAIIGEQRFEQSTGTASNKKEAERQAAWATCKVL